MLKPDPIGIIDLLSGLLLWFTISPVPAEVAQVHAGFLIFKGIGTMAKPEIFPMPVYVLGMTADLMSAAILFTGKPPLLVDYKIFFSGFLFLKGIWSFEAFT